MHCLQLLHIAKCRSVAIVWRCSISTVAQFVRIRVREALCVETQCCGGWDRVRQASSMTQNGWVEMPPSEVEPPCYVSVFLPLCQVLGSLPEVRRDDIAAEPPVSSFLCFPRCNILVRLLRSFWKA